MFLHVCIMLNFHMELEPIESRVHG